MCVKLKVRTFAIFTILAVAGIFVKSRIEARVKPYSSLYPDLKPSQAGYQATSLRRYSFGFEQLVSAMLWVQTLQDSDYRPVNSDAVSWEFAQVDAVTELDPKFERAYEYGAVFLSALRRDKLGGELLLKKWVTRRPFYWRPAYLLGSHYFLNLQDSRSAAPFIIRAAHLKDAPEWLTSLGVRLLSESGALIQAYHQAIALWPAVRGLEGKFRLGVRIRSLNYNLQKSAWEDALAEFIKTHHRNPRSQYELEPYHSAQKRTLASLVDSQSSEDETLKSLKQERFTFQFESSKRVFIPTNPRWEEELGKIGIARRSTKKEGTKP